MAANTSELNVYTDWLGIPEEDLPPDHYALLRCVQFEDDLNKIRSFYNKLNQHVRSYATGKYSKQSQDLLNELARAMLCLTDPERKREYDESLGREFDDEIDLGRIPMGRWLIENRVLTKGELKEAEEFASDRGLSLRDALVQMKLAKPAVVTRALAQQLGMPFLDLSEALPEDDVLDKLTRTKVRRNSIIPMFEDDGVVLIACLDEVSADLEEELRVLYGLPVRWVLTSPPSMNKAIRKYYAPGMREAKPVEKAPILSAPSAPEKKFKQLNETEQNERRLTGIIIICWGIVGSVLVDTFVLPETWTNWAEAIGISFFPFLTAIFVPPSVIYWVTRVYWK
ncbi:GspE/PulE/PilB domain-containing protein [Calycomorphotria hydatis]|uniref:Bacteriophage N4 adsorption protein B n=1 Tax=Calycomorphotria hydatis TaxID=2528027 RepID=A0A517TAX0_9PLAN|nr:general secretion pathway protein GspE [Calycomorphotria hydatis]QDT65514.1 bacteriophage N4 adsorption protein B [Calycomorphotria hydatis]